MALIDLVSDLSKFRSTVKSADTTTTPETSKVKDSRSFGAVLPITERISSLSPNIQKPKETQIESKLPSTKLDDVVKKLATDLTINSVSRLSPVNATIDSVTIGRSSLESIVSKFSNIRQEEQSSRLNRSDVLIIRSESGTNNLTSPTEPNTNLPNQFDRRSSSPNINRLGETPNKAISSPDIRVEVGNQSNDVVNPNTVINNFQQTDDKSIGSPNIVLPSSIDDKSEMSPDVIKSGEAQDKSNQSPDVFSVTQSTDRESQSPNVNGVIQSTDRSSESPTVNSVIQSTDRSSQSVDVNTVTQSSDRAGESPDVFSTIVTPDKSKTSPNINIIQGDQTDNITNPNVEVFGRPLSFDRTGQSVLINKDVVSPINNIINPDVKLDLNVLTFDRVSQSPAIQTDKPDSGLITNPETKVFRIEQGTYHLVDESRLNLDGIPFKFVTSTRIGGRQSGLQKDNPRYDGESIQLTDNSRINLDSVEKTNPSGRNENPDRSILSVKGSQSVNFFTDTNANGFTIKQQKGQTLYEQNSEYSWRGSRGSAPTLGEFDSFVETIGSNLSDKTSKYKWEGTRQSAPSVNYFDISNLSTVSGFDSNTAPLETKYINESSRLGFVGTLPTPVDFIDNNNGDGFINKPTLMSTLFKKDTSRFTFKGNSRQAPSVNYFIDTSNTGFTTFPIELNSEYNTDNSRFSFKGTRQNAPSVNYFVDTYNDGFKNLAESLKTNYKPKTSRFTWVGNREQAPEVNFFKIAGSNPDGIPGFTKLFVDKTATKLSDNFSQLSFAGTTKRSDIKPVPFTKFFGFRPGELSGFMVGMIGRESSLYPILEPRLFADSSAPTRFAIESERAKNKKQRTTDDVSKYVPISLGGLPWFDGKEFGVATLGNQVPFIKTKVAEGYGSTYFRKYGDTVKDSTGGLGYLTKWATTRRSPSPLDNQYNKYSLPEDAFNTDPISSQPYVVRGIQKKGEVENQRWGFGVTFDDGIVRGGAITQAERILQDVIRVGKWSISVKGLLWNAKQIGLQLMNPVADINPDKPESGPFGLSATQIFNPLSIPANVASARAGLHLPRHGIVPFSSNYLNKYGDATIARENKNKFIDPDYQSFSDLETPSITNRQTNYNRLIGLMKELLPNSFQQVRAPSQTGDQLKNAASRAAIELARKLTGQSGIQRISSNVGGAQSFLGIGGTQINRAKHPYLTHYTTTPLLMLTGEQKEPQYQVSAKRDTFYAATAMYKDLFGDVLRTIAYNLEKGPYEINDENLPRDKRKIENIQPSVVNLIEKKNPFNPKYDLFKNRLKSLTSTDIQTDGNISDGLNPLNIDSTNPLKQYRALAYDKLGVSRDRRRSRNGITNVGDINDFRADLLKDTSLNTFSTDPSISDYATQNLEDKFGFGKHGKVNVDRSNPSVSNIQYGRDSKGLSVPKLKSGGEFRGDRINIIDYKRGKFDLSKDSVYEKGNYNDPNLPGTDDLVEFYFTGVALSGTQERPAESLVFRATFGNINDTHNAEWNPIEYMGRADPLYIYKGYTRQIGFDFSVQVTSRDEMKAVWRKLNHLASWTAPEYTKAGFMKAPIIRLNMGHLYRKMPGFITTLDYSIDNTLTTWETAQLKNDMSLTGPDGRSNAPGVLQLPKLVNVNCSFTPIGMYRPEYNGIMYSLFDDTNGGNLETGLAPSTNTKVNYFRSYELDSTGNEETSDSDQNKKYYRIEPGGEAVIPEIQPDNIETLT
jgi:hypothetical protein